MSTIQEDYLLRMIQMMGEVITAALNLKKMQQFTGADKTLDDALHTIMPEHADLVEMVDEKTALTLLGSPDLVEAYVELLLERAEVKITLDQVDAGEALQIRAIRMLMGNIQSTRKINPKGQLIWGRLSGLDLQRLLNKSELDEWMILDEALKRGSIISP